MTFGFSESSSQPPGPAALAGPRVLRRRLLEGRSARDPRLRRALLAALQLLRGRRHASRASSPRSSTRRSATTPATACCCARARTPARTPGFQGGTRGPEPLAPGAEERLDRAAPGRRLGRLRQRQDRAARAASGRFFLRERLSGGLVLRRTTRPSPASRAASARSTRNAEPCAGCFGVELRARPPAAASSNAVIPNNWQWNLGLEHELAAQHDARAELRRQQGQGPAARSTTSTRWPPATSTATASTTAWTSCARAATRPAGRGAAATAPSATRRIIYLGPRRQLDLPLAADAAREPLRPRLAVPGVLHLVASRSATIPLDDSGGIDNDNSVTDLGNPGLDRGLDQDRPHAHLQRQPGAGPAQPSRTSRAS